MLQKIVYLAAALCLSQLANAENGKAFGDEYGNTQYQIVTQTADCGYAGEADTIVRIAASSDFLKLHFPVSAEGYTNTKIYDVMTYGEVSATTVGMFVGYISSNVFVSNTSLTAPYSDDGIITLTQESFTLDAYGTLNYVKSIDGVEVLTCSYQKL